MLLFFSKAPSQLHWVSWFLASKEFQMWEFHILAAAISEFECILNMQILIYISNNLFT